ncbi:MAG: biotin/lipoyl-containing protein, partial [Pseudomonadota bacterium]
MAIIEVTVPDIGDFSDVPVIAVLVSTGDDVAAEDPLIELESDKATMEFPAPQDGKVVEIKVAEGDKVSEGSLILTMETAAAEAPAPAPAPAAETPKSNGSTAPAPAPVAFDGKKGDVHAKLVVLGSGPGGYTAAFRAADLGVETVLI